MLDWQNLVVLAIVAASALYVGRRTFGIGAKKASSDCGCSGPCASRDPRPEIVRIEPPADHQPAESPQTPGVINSTELPAGSRK